MVPLHDYGKYCGQTLWLTLGNPIHDVMQQNNATLVTLIVPSTYTHLIPLDWKSFKMQITFNPIDIPLSWKSFKMQTSCNPIEIL